MSCQTNSHWSTIEIILTRIRDAWRTCSWTNCRNSTEWLRCKISISFHESCNIVEKSNVNKLKAPNSWHLAILDMPTPYICNTSILWLPSVNVTLLLGHHKCLPAGPLGTCQMINLKGKKGTSFGFLGHGNGKTQCFQTRNWSHISVRTIFNLSRSRKILNFKTLDIDHSMVKLFLHISHH